MGKPGLTTVRSRFSDRSSFLLRYDRDPAHSSSNTPCCHHLLTHIPDGWVLVRATSAEVTDSRGCRTTQLVTAVRPRRLSGGKFALVGGVMPVWSPCWASVSSAVVKGMVIGTGAGVAAAAERQGRLRNHREPVPTAPMTTAQRVLGSAGGERSHGVLLGRFGDAGRHDYRLGMMSKR